MAYAEYQGPASTEGDSFKGYVLQHAYSLTHLALAYGYDPLPAPQSWDRPLLPYKPQQRGLPGAPTFTNNRYVCVPTAVGPSSSLGHFAHPFPSTPLHSPRSTS